MPLWSMLSLQDSISPMMQQLLYFHDHVMFILLIITILSFYIIMSLVISKFLDSYLMEGQYIETLWTVLPSLLLLLIAFPSLKALYMLEENMPSNMTMKVIGHQWYWSYETIPFSEFDSFLEESNWFRLLNNSSSPLCFVSMIYRILVTSEDVIHSWSLSSLGLKVDAMPGRINQLFMFSKVAGILTGQCSEICGANHSFMPITMEMLSLLENSKVSS